MRAIAACIGGGALAIAVLAFAGWPASRYVHSDFAGFWLGSRALIEGLDPYDVPTWLALHGRIGSSGMEIRPPGTAYGYPLTAALVFAPFALLPVWLAAPSWLVAQIAVGFTSLVLLARRVFATTLRRDLPLLLGFAVSSQAAWLLAAGGNLGGFLLGGAATAAALLLSGRPFAAGAVAGLLVVKPHVLLAAIPLVLLALPRDRAARFASGALLVSASLVAATLAMRPGWIAEWLTPLSSIGAAPDARATVFGLLPSDWRAFGWLVVAAILVSAAVWLRGRSLALAIGAAVPIAIFCAPYGWSYDHTVLLVTVAIVIGLVAGASSSRRAGVLALLALVTVLLPWTLYALAFRRGDESWSAVVPLALFGVLALAHAVRRAA